MIRKLYSYIPLNCEGSSPIAQAKSPNESKQKMLSNLIPQESHIPYDIKEVILGIIDEDSFFEIQADYASNIVIGFSRINGTSSRYCCQSTSNFSRSS